MTEAGFAGYRSIDWHVLIIHNEKLGGETGPDSLRNQAIT